MSEHAETTNAPYTTQYFPQHVALITVAENMMPIGHWMVISKDPFRLLLAMEMGNHTYSLLQKHNEAAFHFMPWEQRYKVARAGFISGRDYNKAKELDFNLIPAEKFAVYVFDIIATHGKTKPPNRQPILYLSLKDFTTTGESWRYST